MTLPLLLAAEPVDWHQVLVPDVSILEIFVRGTLVYLGLFLMMRLVLKREAGTPGMTDLLVVVLIADAAQNAMADDYHSVPDGLFLVATIIFWSWALNWLGYRYGWVGRLVHPPPLMLVRDGKVLRRNMRQELVTEEELLSTLRQHGLSAIDEVKEARMEGDGRISVIPLENENGNGKKKVEPEEKKSV